jgi:hypothetical protein
MMPMKMHRQDDSWVPLVPAVQIVSRKKRIAIDWPSNMKSCQHAAPVPGLPGGFNGSFKITRLLSGVTVRC